MKRLMIEKMLDVNEMWTGKLARKVNDRADWGIYKDDSSTLISVKAIIYLKKQAYNEFVADLMDDYEVFHAFNEFNSGYDEDNDAWKGYLVVNVDDKKKVDRVLIDTQGYSYARYVSFEPSMVE